MIQLFINNVEVNLPDLINPVVLSYDFTSASSPSAYTTTYSKTISLPLTQVNLSVFDYAHITFNKSSYSYRLVVDGVQVDDGTVVVSSFTDTINLNLHSSLTDLVTKFTDKTKYPDLWALENGSEHWLIVDTWPIWKVNEHHRVSVGHSWLLSESNTNYSWDTYNPTSLNDIFGTVSNIGYPKDDEASFDCEKVKTGASTTVSIPKSMWMQTDPDGTGSASGNNFPVQFRDFQLTKLMPLRNFFNWIYMGTGITFTDEVKNTLNAKFMVLPRLPYTLSESLSEKDVTPSAAYYTKAVPFSPGKFSYTYTSQDFVRSVESGGKRSICTGMKVRVRKSGETGALNEYDFTFDASNPICYGVSNTFEVSGQSSGSYTFEIVETYFTEYNNALDIFGHKVTKSGFQMCIGYYSGSFHYNNHSYSLNYTIEPYGGESAFSTTQSFSTSDVHKLITEPFQKFLDLCKQFNFRFRRVQAQEFDPWSEVNTSGWEVCLATEYYTSIQSLPLDYLDYTQRALVPYSFTSKYLRISPTYHDTKWAKEYKELFNKDFGELNLETSYPIESSKDWFSTSDLKQCPTTRFSYNPCASNSVGTRFTIPMCETLDSKYDQVSIPFTVVCANDFEVATIKIPSNDLLPYCYCSHSVLSSSPEYQVSPICGNNFDQQALFYFGEPKAYATRSFFHPVPISSEPITVRDNKSLDFRDIYDASNSQLLTIGVRLTDFLIQHNLTFDQFLSTAFHFDNHFWVPYSISSYPVNSREPVSVTFLMINELSNYGLSL